MKQQVSWMTQAKRDLVGLTTQKTVHSVSLVLFWQKQWVKVTAQQNNLPNKATTKYINQ